MNIKKILNTVLNFTINRLFELFGLIICVISILLMIALLSHNPGDPNFIFNQDSGVKNLLGFRGSHLSDILFQSLGLICFLLPFTFLFTGINIFRIRKISLIIENIFFIILYSIFGTLFLSIFYKDSFWLYINGNGGFIGNYLSNSFVKNIILINEDISYYLLLIIIISLFLISINFKIKTLNLFLMSLLSKFKGDDKIISGQNNFVDDLKNENPVFESRVQENFSFSQDKVNYKMEKKFR